ncbi:conserved hypothetical protein [delta proteobacterium NaphS2]|nr:conserved hypothetical protein [delta proteobacterium NaphS2]
MLFIVADNTERSVAESHGISRRKLVELEQSFVHCGALGLLPKLSWLIRRFPVL